MRMTINSNGFKEQSLWFIIAGFAPIPFTNTVLIYLFHKTFIKRRVNTFPNLSESNKQTKTKQPKIFHPMKKHIKYT